MPFFCTLKKSNAQSYNFQYYTVAEGLAQSQIYSIIEDSRGYMWFGSDGGGISQFDGLHFKTYTEDDGLCNNQIRAIFEDNNKNIWIGANQNYISFFDGKKFKTYNSKSGLKSHTYQTFAQTKNGTIWTGSKYSGLYYLENDKFKSFQLEKNNDTIDVSVLFKDNTGKLWVGTRDNGLYVLESNKIIKKFNVSTGFLSNNINCINQDKKNRIWIGTNIGAVCLNGESTQLFLQKGIFEDPNIVSIAFDLKNNVWFGSSQEGVCKYDGTNFKLLNESNGLQSIYTTSIIADRFGNIWIGAANSPGLCKFESERFSYLSKLNGLPSNIVMSIYQDNKNAYWFGTYGGGLCKLDNGVFKTWNQKNGLCSNVIYTITQDKNNNFYAGSKDNGFSIIKNGQISNFSIKNGLPSNRVYSFEFAKENVWIGTNGGGLSLFKKGKFANFKTNDGLSSLDVYDLIIDKQERLWIATESGGIFILDNAYNEEYFNNSQLFKSNIHHFDVFKKKIQVLSLVMDSIGVVWIGTFGNGVYSYDGKNLNNYTTKNGLNSNYIYLVHADKNGCIWTGTEKGINKLSFKNGQLDQIRTYSKSEGFNGIETNLNAVLEDNKDNLWFGTVLGATVYNSKDDKINFLAPTTNITDINLFFEKIDWSKYSSNLSSWYKVPDNFVLNYDENHITFNFIGIDMINSDKVSYQYILEGFDTKWSPKSTKTDATFSNLPSGEYIFKVKSCNSNGIWSSEKAIHFTVLSPFWKKWWFQVSLLIIVLSSFILFFKYRTRQLAIEKKNLEELVEKRTIKISKQKEEIQEQANKLEEANTELEKLSIVARETDNSIAIADKDGNIEWVNEGFTRLFGYTLEEFLITKGKNLIEGSSNPNIKSEIVSCIETRNPVTYISQTETKYRNKIWIQTTLSPVTDSNDSLIKIVAIDSDISALKLAEVEINLQKEEILSQRDQLSQSLKLLKELEEFKDAQAAMIVHDLKNPLSFILNFASKSASDLGNKLIRQAARQSLNLVLNILDVQKYEKAEMKLELLPCNISSMCSIALQDVEVFIDDKSLQIENNIPAEFMANADQDIIVRVLMNLITNAIKYSPNGGKLEFSAVKQDSFIKIGVKDNGEGISKELQESVFEKFSQVKAKSIGAARSTGLGLTFCKLAVESHGGKIWIESELGKGASFFFTLLGANDIEVTKKEELKKEIVVLTEEEIKILRNFQNKIEKMDIYETSENLLLVDSIKASLDSTGIFYFTTELENAILNFNEVKIAHLLDLLK
ncbi:MAG: two-component regulator propeller domain-containing protein [Bacteroidota bacterium]